MSDLISRQAAIDALGEEPPVWYEGEDEIAERNQWRRDVEAIKALPSAQPEPAIPISWLEKEIERLESYENSFSVLDAMQLKMLIKRWRGEQNG